MTVKEVKAKVLPELDEDFAIEQGFDTVDELRPRTSASVSSAELSETIEGEFRRVALDAAVANATVEVPDALIEARARELWDQMAHSLSHQGIDRATYLTIAGKTEEEVVDEAKPDAADQLRREAVLAAIVDAEAIEPTDDDVLEALEASGRARGHDAQEAVREDPLRRPPRHAARGSGDQQGARRRRRHREADHRRAGPGARQAVDPGRETASAGAPSKLITPGD